MVASSSFLALTGQRREEVAQLTWDEVDLASRTWTLPASRTKNGKPHIVHLSNEAIAVLMCMPKTGEICFLAVGYEAVSELQRGETRTRQALRSHRLAAP